MNAAIVTRTAFERRSARILPQYYTPEYHPMWPLARISLMLIGGFLAIFTGLFVAIGGTLAVKFVAAPLAFFIIIVLWLLPDAHRATEPPFAKLLAALVAVRVIWPNYIALVLPGLPWLTPARVVLAAALIMMVVHFAQVSASRRRVADILGHDPMTLRMYTVFLAVTFLLVPFSSSPFDTLDFTLQRLVLNMAPIVFAAWAFVQVERVTAMIRLMNIVLVITMLITVLELYMQMPPWALIIPDFLRIDPAYLEIVLSPQARIGDNRYRVRATFPLVLYYTQFVGLVLPMLMYSMVKMRGRAVFFAILLVPLILQTTWFMNSRTAFIALFTSVFGFGGLLLLRTVLYPKTRDSLKVGIAVAVVLCLLGAVAGAIAGSHRLKMYTFGGAQHTGSNDVRDEQWDNTWRQLKVNPIGVGLGNSPSYVGVYLPTLDAPVVDSLWINLLVDVGVVGFLAFYGSMVRLAWLGVMTFLRAENETEELAGGLAISMLIFLISSYVISHYDNLHIVFIVAAAILALHRSQQQRLGVKSSPAERAASRAIVPYAA